MHLSCSCLCCGVSRSRGYTLRRHDYFDLHIPCQVPKATTQKPPIPRSRIEWSAHAVPCCITGRTCAVSRLIWQSDRHLTVEVSHLSDRLNTLAHTLYFHSVSHGTQTTQPRPSHLHSVWSQQATDSAGGSHKRDWTAVPVCAVQGWLGRHSTTEEMGRPHCSGLQAWR